MGRAFHLVATAGTLGLVSLLFALTPHKTLDRFNRSVERLKMPVFAASEQVIGARHSMKLYAYSY
jgi:hypothetical protein